jgi:hypothetical protein
MAAVSTWENDPLDAIETIEEDGSWVSCILLPSHKHQEMLIQPVLPAGSTILSKHPFGASFWTPTVRINVRTQSTTREETAEEKSYFMKVWPACTNKRQPDSYPACHVEPRPCYG